MNKLRYITCGHCGNVIGTHKKQRLMGFECSLCHSFFEDECDCPDLLSDEDKKTSPLKPGELKEFRQKSKKEYLDKYQLGRVYVREDLRKKGVRVPIGEEKYYGGGRVLRSRWSDNGTVFEVFYRGTWLTAESIDFDHL